MPKYERLKEPLALEQEILEFWEANKIFERSLDKTRDYPRYVFYEGPPTANGKPHFGHLMPRVYKDLFPRYKTMRGFYVLRKGGWDTHGLPVELEVEKALGLNSKKDIEKYGVENFINKCKESVWEYKADWEQMLRRMGFWIDIENAYITMRDEYIESVWWALKEIWKQGLLYQGYKVLPYCPRCGTPLSSHEVAQGYDEITEPAITVKFKLKNRENEYVLAWTTTPWTLPGNVALAVGAEIDYLKVRQAAGPQPQIYYLAAARAAQVLQGEYEVLGTLKGSEMEGWEYEPLLPFLKDALATGPQPQRAWYLVTSEIVSVEEGTGVVHTAVMYGEEDYELGERLGLPKYHTVDLNGRFTQDVKPWAGRFVKDCDKEIIQYLKEQGKLYKVENYTHAYPFCWRCDTPLIYYAVDSWFIRTTAKQREIIANNKQINWHPEHMRDGRFGDFLETMKDWTLSRERYWGTPLPIWVCESCQKQICVGSRKELIERAQDIDAAVVSPKLVELHKPYIDEVFLKCPDCHGQMRRVPQVIDCWFDSGMMHTAQWAAGPQPQHELRFREQFPADFICEGLDQTRGWFYSLLVTSTLLYPHHEYPHPYKNVIVTGQGLDASGKRMSKSRGNVLDPMEIVDEYGADALRWYLYSGGAPWRDRVLSKEAVGESGRFLETLRNVYSFFALYANIDDFSYEQHKVAANERALLDRWILSRLQGTVRGVTDALEQYDVVEAARYFEAFVDDLSNWYVRSSRPRFWGEETISESADKRAAYSTLYEVLVELSKLLAPFVPFLAEAMYRSLKQTDMPQSVHLCDWPTFHAELYDAELEKEMALARNIVRAGLQARNKAKIKVRQPLGRAVFYLRDCTAQERQRLCHSELGRLIQAELNVKMLEAEDLVTNLHKYGSYDLRIKKAKLGPKYGKLLPKIERAVQALDDRLRLAVEDELRLAVEGQEIVLGQDEFEKEFFANEGFADGHYGPAMVILETALDEELRQEGYIRELVHQLQELRKKAGYEVTDRIALFYQADDELQRAIAKYAEHIKAEALALELHQAEPTNVDYAQELSVNGLRVRVGLLRRK